MSTTYPKRSIPALLLEILKPGKRAYPGADGLASYFSNLAELCRDGMMLQAASLSALSQLGGADAAYVMVPGTGLYRFNPLPPAVLPSANMSAYGGGMWEFLMATGAPYRRVIGDAVSLSFDIPHNMGDLFPTVEVYDTLAGAPYARSRDYTMSVVDANTVRITTDGLDPWGGDSHTVVVKH